MSYPAAQELYNIAQRLGPVDSDIIRAAADELIERRQAMMLHEAEIGRLRTVIRVNILRLAPGTSHAEVDDIISNA